MLDQRRLAELAPLTHGHTIVAGCQARRASTARHLAATGSRIGFAVLLLVSLPIAFFGLRAVGLIWIGAFFVVAPAIAYATRLTSGLSRAPQIFDAVVTGHSVLLVTVGHGRAPSVAYVYPRHTLRGVAATGRQLVMVSAGQRIVLRVEPDDARQMAAILRAQSG